MYYCIMLTASFALKDNKQQALLSRKIEITHIIIIDIIDFDICKFIFSLENINDMKQYEVYM